MGGVNGRRGENGEGGVASLELRKGMGEIESERPRILTVVFKLMKMSTVD